MLAQSIPVGDCPRTVLVKTSDQIVSHDGGSRAGLPDNRADTHAGTFCNIVECSDRAAHCISSKAEAVFRSSFLPAGLCSIALAHFVTLSGFLAASRDAMWANGTSWSLRLLPQRCVKDFSGLAMPPVVSRHEGTHGGFARDRSQALVSRSPAPVQIAIHREVCGRPRSQHFVWFVAGRATPAPADKL